MKICVVTLCTAQENPLYYNNQEIGLAKSLLKYGVSTDIFVYSKNVKTIRYLIIKKNLEAEVRIFECPGIRMPGRQAISISLLKYLSNNYTKYSFFQVHDNTAILSVFIAMFARFVKRPCVLFQGQYRDFQELHKKILQIIYDTFLTRYLLRSVNLVICKTKMAMEYLRSKGLKDTCRTEIIHVGLDVEKINESGGFENELRAVLPKNIDILYIGRLERRRNAKFMMNLFQKIVENNNNAAIVLVGDGPELVNCKNMIKGFNIEKNVFFLGKIKNNLLSIIYNRSKILILPSNYEIYGMVILEAMYFGVPVIASNTAGPCEIIQNGHDGIILKDISLQNWYNAITKLLIDEDYRKQLSINARQKVLYKFTWDNIAGQFLNAYNSIL